jgi:hypothetical protein
MTTLNLEIKGGVASSESREIIVVITTITWTVVRILGFAPPVSGSKSLKQNRVLRPEVIALPVGGGSRGPSTPREPHFVMFLLRSG